MENQSIQISTELLLTLQELKQAETRNLRINRIKMLCAILVLVIVIATVVIVFTKVGALVKKIDAAAEILTQAGESINRVSTDIEKMGIEKLGKTLNSIVDMSEETIGEIHNAVGGLDTLVKDADDAMMRINGINFGDLNNGIQRLNEVLEPVAKFFNSFH